MKHVVLIAIFFTLVLGLVSFAGYRWVSDNMRAVSSDTTKTRIEVAKGSSAEQIANQLYKEGIIRNPLAFKIYVQLYDKADKIQPGVFNISPNMRLAEVVERLLGKPDETRVTIPEGKRREEVVEILIKSLELKGDDAEVFRKEFIAETVGKEGYLFPDTYNFLPGTNKAKPVADRLTSTFNLVTKDLQRQANAAKYTVDQIVTMASLVEKEATGNADDPQRGIIAGILYNRLEADWPLQVDAAVQYAIGSRDCKGKIDCKWWPQSLTKEDIAYRSPFNTYLNTGLPPSPIANPGLSSIKAAYAPETTDYWFYIHGSDGVIRYAKTLSEQNENVRKYLGQ